MEQTKKNHESSFRQFELRARQLTNLVVSLEKSFRKREEENANLRQAIFMIAKGTTDPWARDIANDIMKSKYFKVERKDDRAITNPD